MKRMLLVAAIAALTIAAPAQAGTDTAQEQSQALLATPAYEPFEAVTAIPAATARVVADRVAASIPLPSGGTFDGVRWEEAGGEFSQTEIASVLQYNAACQWLRAWRDGREEGTSEDVVADLPSWPAWRFGETAAVLGQVAAEVQAGGGELATSVVADCDASQEREASYAAARGLTPSR